MGLAIAADLESGYSLEERFSRFFGVWRESEDGSKISFDPMFAKDTVLPPLGQPPFSKYCDVIGRSTISDISVFECSSLENVTHDPCGDIIADEVYL
ncbi:MAG: hypothetical protein U0V70_13895 [Terriglobia bacterium]